MKVNARAKKLPWDGKMKTIPDVRLPDLCGLNAELMTKASNKVHNLGFGARKKYMVSDIFSDYSPSVHYQPKSNIG